MVEMTTIIKQIKEIKAYEKIIHAKEKELKKMEEQYIEENAEFEIGQKVHLVIPEHRRGLYGEIVPERKEVCFVRSRYLNVSNLSGFKVEYKLLKSKKDGTPSKFKQDRFYWVDTRLEAIKE